MRQFAHQIPRALVGQPLGISGGHNRSPLSLGTVGSHVHLQCPPLLLVTILETSRHLHPRPRMACISPGFASRYRRFPRRTYLAHLVPPGVGGLQSQHITRAEFAKAPFETLVFSLVRNPGSFLAPSKW